ncbi:MAG: hypothetical protein OXI94_03485 [Gemmatimonadota bacterium]|nr:hypothetical protein [Gemmatimonadota bacterium]
MAISLEELHKEIGNFAHKLEEFSQNPAIGKEEIKDTLTLLLQLNHEYNKMINAIVLEAAGEPCPECKGSGIKK